MLQQNGAHDDQLHSRLVGSSERSLPQLKRRESDGKLNSLLFYNIFNCSSGCNFLYVCYS